MALASSVRSPHLLLIAHSMILSVILWLHIHISKMRELRGRSEFAKSTFGAFSAVPTCLADSGLMRCVTSASYTLIALMPTAGRCGKSWTAFSLTRCVTIWLKICMSLARMSRATCLANILMYQIRLMMIVLRRVCLSEKPYNS